MQSFFSNVSVQREVEELYQKKLDELAISYTFQFVETSFGKTNLILTGKPDGPPLVLIHGFNGCAPVAIEALIGLVDHFRIYAIDVVGHPNLSEGFRPKMDDDSYGQWVYEILTRLKLERVTLVGISFGGFITWKTLAFDGRRIAQAFLIVPVGIVNGNLLKIIPKVVLPMKVYQWRKKTKYLQRFLGALFSQRDTFAIAFLEKVFLHFKIDETPIPLIRKVEGQKIRTPVHVVAADQDVLFPGNKLLKRVRELIPSLEKVLLLKDSKHVPDVRGNEQIVALIKAETNRQAKHDREEEQVTG